MNLKECLLILIVPLAVIPIFICFIIFSLFSHKPTTVFFIALVIAFVATVVALGIARFFSDAFLEITGATGKIATGDVDAKIETTSSVREVESLSKSIETMRIKLLRSKEQDLKEARLKAIGKTASQVAHDIRGPLSSMRTALEYFDKMDLHQEGFSEHLNLLQLSSKRLTGIANNLLEQYKGKSSSCEKLFSVYPVLDELIGEILARHQHPNIIFQKRYQARAVELYGRPGKLQRAFGNLFKNAIEAMDSPGTITISVEADDTHATVSVADTGVGMSPEQYGKIMREGVSNGKENGHGIGLTVVREIVGEFGGDIWVQSELGKGTTFFIKIPLPSEEILMRVTKSEATANQCVVKAFADEPIVVIDDDASLCEQWRLLLRKEGKGAVICRSYEDFIEQEITVKVSRSAIVDYHYDNSEKDGAFILSELKKAGFVNLVLCTAEYWKPSIQKFVSKLGADLIPKPLPGIKVEIVKNLSEGNSQKRGSRKVLILNDDDALLFSFKMMLRSTDLNVLQATTVEEAVNQFKENKVDVILSDINLGEGAPSGYDFLRHVRATDDKLPFYMVSGYSYNEEGEKAKSNGATGYLQLPIDKKQLIEVIQ